ncbi:MAG TPA: hypothetical protein VGJ60_06810 [Chloroflexota bacterium]|jgi:hypothetical protein
MAANTRTPLQREKDFARTEELHLRGYTAPEIASEMGVSPEQIRQDLKKIAQQYAQSTLRNYDVDLNQQLRKLDLLERSAWRFLGQSEQDREITVRRQRSRSGEDGETTVREASTRTEQRDPDSRYMTVIQWCIAERNRLLGLYPADEAKPQTHVNVTEIVYELAPQKPAQGMTIIGASSQASLVNGQVEALSPPAQEIERVDPNELWGVEPESVED